MHLLALTIIAAATFAGPANAPAPRNIHKACPCQDCKCTTENCCGCVNGTGCTCHQQPPPPRG